MRTGPRRQRGLAALGGLVAILLALGAADRALAADDEDDASFEEKIIKNVLGGLGVDVGQGKNIDYRERSPLVIPPSHELPPPEDATEVNNNPQWPKDPDLQPKKKSVSKKKDLNASVRQYNSDRATASPDELRGTVGPQSSSVTEPKKEAIDNTSDFGGRALPPDQLGPPAEKSLLSWGSLFGSKQEQSQFTGEPERTSLTQPPAGYQVPSPNYPYGLSGKDNTPVAVPKPEDHGTQSYGNR